MARKSSWLIVRAAADELKRQEREGILSSCGKLDDSGHIHVAGNVDLARLAAALEGAFSREFFAAALAQQQTTGGGI